LLLVQGVDQRVVMDLFGWTSGAMANRYQHVVSEVQAAAADRVADLLFGDRPERLTIPAARSGAPISGSIETKIETTTRRDPSRPIQRPAGEAT